MRSRSPRAVPPPGRTSRTRLNRCRTRSSRATACHSGIRLLSHLCIRRNPAELVEEVEDERDSIELGFGLSLRGFQDGETLTVRVEIEVANARSAFGEGAVRPLPRFVRTERITFHRIRSNPNSLICGSVEQFLSVSRPRGVFTAIRRDCPFANAAWKRAYVNFIFPRFVGL